MVIFNLPGCSAFSTACTRRASKPFSALRRIPSQAGFTRSIQKLLLLMTGPHRHSLILMLLLIRRLKPPATTVPARIMTFSILISDRRPHAVHEFRFPGAFEAEIQDAKDNQQSLGASLLGPTRRQLGRPSAA